MIAVLPILDGERCQGCGDCVAGCPTGAVALVEGRAAIVHPDDCNYCADCETLCPRQAISCPFEIVLGD
ncbi:MAG: 4Fe-4S dicluster domain-containing protein [Chloroflexi bacterium]|nr:4Fe-4S dicluster domain-containing protein [Chloroflexota bacterium]MCL5110917.1 4Fe-4S dicluster domain-containing protein [Chloroflexota bacterium]